MPLGHITAKGPEDHPLFSTEQRNTLTAQTYRDMSDREYLQRRDDYYESHPLANQISWRQYLENLADTEHNEIWEAETAATSQCCQTRSKSSSGVAEYYEFCTPVPQPSIKPNHGQGDRSCGRYNAGVRALQSPDTPGPPHQAQDEQFDPSKGRYNMGVRALRSPDTPLPPIQADNGQVDLAKGRYNTGVRGPRSLDGRCVTHAEPALEPFHSVFPRLEEDSPVSGCRHDAA